MLVDVVLLPRDLRPEHLTNRTVVVFDVLRATTSMAAALSVGVSAIRIFPDTSTAQSAACAYEGSHFLCGEINTRRPPGFDLGNSPGGFEPRHAGSTLFMSTTNGTRAILAARGARATFIGALVNASATARAVAARGLDVTLLCSGTSGEVSLEDLLGCGAVLRSLEGFSPIATELDLPLIARRLYAAGAPGLVEIMRNGRGGRNIIAAGLEADIDFAARLDSLDVVGFVDVESSVVRRLVTA